MTQTPNIGLKKIDGSENWRNVFDYHNDSMDLADEAFAGVRAGLTYVENGDTIAANANYTVGRFISWKGEIYRVKTTINATVTSGNWTTYLDKMDGMGGALSQINGDLASLNSNITPVGFDTTNGEKISSFYTIRMRMGKLCVISGYLSINSQLSAGDVIVTLPFPATNTGYRFAFAKNDGSGKTFFARLNSSNQIVVDGTPSDTGSDQYYLFDIVFFAN